MTRSKPTDLIISRDGEGYLRMSLGEERPLLAEFLEADLGGSAERTASLLAQLEGPQPQWEEHGNAFTLQVEGARARLEHALLEDRPPLELDRKELVAVLRRWLEAIQAARGEHGQE